MMLAAVALLFSTFSTQPEYSAKTTLMQALAYDYVTLSLPPIGLTGNVFKEKTGFDVYTFEGAIPAGRQLVVAAAKYAYNKSCNALDCGKSCSITKADADGSAGYGCLSHQTTDRFGIISTKAWVSTP